MPEDATEPVVPDSEGTYLPIVVESMRIVRNEEKQTVQGYAVLLLTTPWGRLRIRNVSVKTVTATKGERKGESSLRAFMPGEWTGKPGSDDRKFRPAVDVEPVLFDTILVPMLLERFHAECLLPSVATERAWKY